MPVKRQLIVLVAVACLLLVLCGQAANLATADDTLELSSPHPDKPMVDLEGLIQNEALASVASAKNGRDFEESGRVKQNCHSSIYKYMDNLAVKLSDAISRHANKTTLLNELRDAINMVDMLKTTTSSKIGPSSKADAQLKHASAGVHKPPVKYKKFGSFPRGLTELLEDDKHNENEHIVRAKTQISEKALRELVEFAKSGPISTEKFMQFYSDPRWNKNYYDAHILQQQQQLQQDSDLAKFNKIQSVKSFLIHAFTTSSNLVDQLYMSTGFLDQLPIIGGQVSKLKKSGQGVYDIIRTVRSLKTLMEIYKNPEKFDIKSSAGDAKKMLSTIGIDALRCVGLSLLKSYPGIDLNPGNLSEIAGRTAYYLLIQFAPHAKDCIAN